MTTSVDRAIAIVGVGAVLPGAPDARAFWRNLSEGRYSISETPAARWDSALYYDPDPDAPDKTYSKIGGWVRDWDWNPREWRLPIPPKVSQQMDLAQIWAIVASRETLADYGYPERAMDPGRTAVIFGNALGGDTHLLSALRILFPEIGEELRGAPSFVALPAEVRSAVMEELLAGVRGRIPDITEDTMPGELANIVAGRIAALFDFKGPNYVTDAACASAMAAMSAAVEGLAEGHYDAVLTGGIDANMSASTFVKFCKIGALSGTGTRPYAEGADGFVMGEGAACFLLKRLADAEEDGDRIYAVIRSLGGSSDGRGKGITAPNPIGQRLAVERAWERIGLAPAPGDLVEGHGTSTRVGDIVEVESLSAVFSSLGLPVGSVALGSVKSNIGHLKGAAGAAGLLKAALSLHEKMIPPSLNFLAPNPEIDFSTSPFVVNTELRPWAKPGNGNVVRRAGVSAFGFGGTNFHAVLEEHVPGRLRPSRAMVAGADLVRGSTDMGALPRVGTTTRAAAPVKAPLRGALCLGGADEAELARRLRDVAARAAEGHAPEPSAPLREDLDAPVRVAVDHGDTSELADLAEKAAAALEGGDAGRWKALRNKGVYLGRGRPGKVAFLFTGQGSQYVDMIRDLWETEPLVADVFAEADETMRPLLDGGTLTERVFLAGTGEDQAAAEESLKQTAVTQPAVLAVDTALARILGAYGIEPDMVMGHSLGEYAALVAAGALSFSDALTAVSARGRAMTHLSMEDNGLMAAVFGPVERVDEILAGVDGYVVVANLNSTKECVIGGATDAMGAATLALQDAGLRVTSLPVSHAFHTRIVQPAAEPLMEVLRGLDVRPPRIPVVANVDGEFYPMHPGVEEDIVRILGRQIGSPVQFVRGLRTLHGAGATIFVEAGPKRSLYGFAEDVLGDEEDVSSFFTNHPRTGGVTSVNRALCGLYARGLGRGRAPLAPEIGGALPGADGRPGFTPAVTRPANAAPPGEDRLLALGRMFADFMEKSLEVWAGSQLGPAPVRVGITGASLGLPGLARVFDESGVERILRGEQFIGPVPEALRVAQVERRITRLVKDNNGEARFETIADREDVVKLAGRGGELDLVEEYGYPADRVAALDRVTRLAIAAGLDALRDAGIPLIRRYKTTTTGSQLPVGWSLPEEMRDDTGVILGSAFPGYDTFARNLRSFHEDQARRGRLQELRSIREELGNGVGEALDRRVEALAAEVERHSFALDRRFLFQVLSMGHSQFAEFIGARGPNTAVNAACASGTQAISLARDWISTGQCGRVIVLTADDVTTDELFPWMGSGFLATGAAATDALVEDAALPFDRRRHGMIVGMGGAALVVEDLSVAASRGIVPIAELLGSVVANSAFHGTRLDTSHIADVMEDLVAGVEARWGLNRRDLARHMVFVSHETYTPARGGSAGAEVEALRHVFGSDADGIVVANTKGYTGHPMGVAIEDTLAVKILETGIVPPVANFAEVDPDLGRLNLSSGGRYDVRYALRLAAGFGSQVSVSLVRWTPPPDGARREPSDLGFHHRLADPGAWARWLMAVTGYESPELEVVRRTLRVRDDGPPRMPVSVRSRPAAVMEPTPGVASGPPVAAAVPERGVPERDVTEPAVAKPVATGPVVAEPVMPEPAVTKPVDPGPVRSLPVDPVRIRVLEIVADQTGYPVDMLDLDLDLEADLGIDTVKQAEMFAAIREAYDIERDENLALREYPTLGHAIAFVYERRPDLEPGLEPDREPGREARPASVTAGPAAAVAPAAPTAPVTPEPAAPTEAPDAADPVRIRVLEIVADQTGYPVDMLDLDLDLEADLGIDTVKQAEMFAAIREAYDIERDERLALREYPTLGHAIAFVYERRPDLATDLEPDLATEAVAVTPGVDSREVARAVPRRVPVSSLRPPIDRFLPTGVTLDEADRIVVAADRGGVWEALAQRLDRLGITPLLLEPGTGREEAVRRVDAWRTEGPVKGVIWLPALDVVPGADLLDSDSRGPVLDTRIRALYGLARAVYDDLEAPGTFLLAATRLGGRHGYGADGAADVAGGGVVGFTKALSRERPDCMVKAVDFAEGQKPTSVAYRLLDEIAWDPGIVEVGYVAGHRWCVRLEERPLGTPGDGPRWEPGRAASAGLDDEDGEPVIVVTGAAGSIVSAIVTDLAPWTRGTYWLLDLTPEPDPDDPDLARLDSEGLRRDLFERMKARGERATPALVEREVARLERTRAALDALRAVEDAGGRARYRCVDLLDAEAVRSVMGEVLDEHGRVDALIHAAGLEISRALPDKEPGEFDRVFDVKVEGCLNLLSALGEAPVGTVVVFSSIAGRFGNAGQTDYSAANDLLCKLVAGLPRFRPGTRGIAIDWTAWADIGMASRGSIPAIMREAGIDMLAPEVGIPVVRRELAAAFHGEVVIAGALGRMLPAGDATPLDLAALEDQVGAPGAMIHRATGFGAGQGLVAEATLDPCATPYLMDHRIDGTALLPGVMGMEAMAEAALIPFPERHVVALEDVEFHQPFKFYRDEPRTLTVWVDYTLDGADVMGHCRVTGARILHGMDEPEVTTHFTATVRLSPSAPRDETERAVPEPEGEGVAPADIYDVYFHGPAYQVLGRAWRTGEVLTGRFAEALPPNAGPEGGRTITGPRLVELAFQTAGLAELAETSRMGLPHHLDRLAFHRDRPEEAAGFTALVEADEHGGFDVDVTDSAGRVALTLTGYRTAALPQPLDSDAFASLRACGAVP